MTQHSLLHCKVAVVGPAHAGKTALIHALLNKSTVNLKPTVSVQVVSGRLTEHNMHMYFVDSGGIAWSHKIAKPLIDEADFLLLVYDASSRESFETLKKIVAELNLSNLRTPCVLVANKTDLNTAIAGITEGEFAAFKADNQQAHYVAANQHNVHDLAKLMHTCFSQSYNSFLSKIAI